MKKFFLHNLLIALLSTHLLAEQNIPMRVAHDSLRYHLLVLADDSLQGRGTGTLGCEKSAEYLRTCLKRYGVVPFSNYPNYFQMFPVHGSTPFASSQFTLFAPKDAFFLKLNEDYVLYTTGDQTFIPQPTRLVFVGYGIIAPEYDYNDYQNIDVKNSIVVFLSGEPYSSDGNFFNGKNVTIHSSIFLKQKIALSLGARGSILIPSPQDDEMNDWYEQQKQFRFEEARLLSTPSENLNILLNPKLAPLLFTNAKFSFDDITTFDKSGTMRSFSLELRASFQGQFKNRDFQTSNVLGIIPGNDSALKDSYVLLTAHYDHLGIGPSINGDSIYNGLFDNASGTAALLEIARVLSAQKNLLRRSVIVCFLTGEERGFLGSQYYCLNPPVPLYKTIANINIDGISLFEQTRTFIGIGGELSTLGKIFEQTLVAMNYVPEKIPENYFKINQFQNSDQFIFAQAGIPSILLTEGLQYIHSRFEEGLRRFVRWSEEQYHSPFDDLHQQYDVDAAAQHAEIILQTAITIANNGAPPEWYNSSPFIQAQLRSRAEKK